MFTHSIRWRLQIWLGILLLGLLVAFGVTSWQLERAQRVQRLDDELARRAVALGVSIRPPDPPSMGNRGPSNGQGGPRPRDPGERERRPPREEDSDRYPFGNDGKSGEFGPGPPPMFRTRNVSDDVKAMFPGLAGEGYYYVVWTGRQSRVQNSDNAPVAVPLPVREARDTQTRFRDRDGMREAFHFTEMGECVLAGRPVGDDLAGMKHYATRLSFIGVGVLVIGLGGGWWLTARSIRPIEQIAGAAKRISEGKLSERIPVDQPDSELGQLATVLNSTFERLEDTFAQQRRFTSDASHELRTPLSVLIAETQTALSRERPVEEYREVLAGNLDTARQMKRLAEALLELARLDAGETRAPGLPVGLAALAGDVLGRLGVLAKARDVTLLLEGETAMLTGSPDRLALIISNLVENAIHHGRHDGTVVVSCRADDDGVELQVRDDGPGISAEDLPHVFERFYRADKSRTGSEGRYGLGLAICRGLVEAEGGNIRVESVAGQGARFIVRWAATPG
ncbi:ATP-binding protein [Luteolibacter flavescens]|uniref:histidine kinase n=1 Tax=Luteolibacter flavescens TaxID=1859460 RepID=A0ABT3FIM5_9BACT|nr:ATP-binding protein [Luteolibacter flavescens]MCW1883419.1 ATP-binding protein [Luteolibacter flavescens]